MRLLKQVRKDYPHLKMIVVEDGLHSNALHIKLNKNLSITKSLYWKILNNWTLIIRDDLAKVTKVLMIVRKRNKYKATKLKLELVIACLPQFKVEMLYKVPIILSQINNFLGRQYIPFNKDRTLVLKLEGVLLANA